MSAAVRFLCVAVLGWAGIRAATLGMVPGSDFFTLRPKAAPAASLPASPAPPLAMTEFPPLQPPLDQALEGPLVPSGLIAAGAMPLPMRPHPVYYYHAPAAWPVAPQPAALPLPPRRKPFTPILPEPAPLFYSPIPQLDDWPLSRIASAALPARRSAVAAHQQSLPPGAVKPRLDRLQLTAWALLRGEPGPASLASGGTLGGSQAGARLTYHFTPELAASLRTTSPVATGARGGEIAAGLRVTPLRSIPVSLTAERRQAIGRFGGGRSAFAVFVEGGLYQRPIGWGFSLDGYAQAGIVGARRRDFFADGGFALTRPLYRQFSGGFGIWGGMQPGLYRVDAGPRLSMKVRRNMRVHLDWRQRVAGNAAPGSGPTVTLAADF